MIENVSRRRFLQAGLAGGVFVLAAKFVPEIAVHRERRGSCSPAAPTRLYGCRLLRMAPSPSWRTAPKWVAGAVLPSLSSSPTNWTPTGRKSKIDQAIGDPRYGDQDTDGSHSVRSNFDLMRQVGAAGRAMLITAAAQQWNVPAKECTTEPHFVVHRASGRKLGYGELAASAAKLPVPPVADLISQDRVPSGVTSARTPMRLFDLPDIVTGKAIFGMDATMPGMVYASDRASTGARAENHVLRRQSRAESARRQADSDHRHRNPTASFQAARRRRRYRRQHLGYLQRTQGS